MATVDGPGWLQMAVQGPQTYYCLHPKAMTILMVGYDLRFVCKSIRSGEMWWDVVQVCVVCAIQVVYHSRMSGNMSCISCIHTYICVSTHDRTHYWYDMIDINIIGYVDVYAYIVIWSVYTELLLLLLLCFIYSYLQILIYGCRWLWACPVEASTPVRSVVEWPLLPSIGTDPWSFHMVVEQTSTG